MSNTANCVVRILNERTGKFEVEESTDVSVVSVGVTGTSLYLVGKDLQSTWFVEIRVTGKGSLKVDNILQRWDMSQQQQHIVPSAPLLPDIDNNIPSPQSVPIQDDQPIVSDSPIVSNPPQLPAIYDDSQPIVSIPTPLTQDIDTWRSSKYFVAPDIRQAFSTAYRMLQRRPYKSVNMLMTGESGYGKTTVAQDFARWANLDCLRVNCGAITDPTEWFYDREVIQENGASITKFVPSEFALAIERGNCVIILDEFNRLSPYMHNALFPLLDEDGKTTLHHREYRVGANVIFVATVNLGYKFTGTDQLDDALTNRFKFILEVKPLPFDIEQSILEVKEDISSTESETIVRVANKIRDNKFGISCSTRDTLAIAEMVACGMTIRDAYEFAVIKRIPAFDETGIVLRKTVLDLVSSELGVCSTQQIDTTSNQIDDANAINANI